MMLIDRRSADTALNLHRFYYQTQLAIWSEDRMRGKVQEDSLLYCKTND